MLQLGEKTIIKVMINGKVLPHKETLTLPFSERYSNYEIPAGWMYSMWERKNLNAREGFHGEVDYRMIKDGKPEYGSDVLAPIEGYAMSSYWSFPKTATKRIYEELVEQQVMYEGNQSILDLAILLAFTILGTHQRKVSGCNLDI